MNQRARTAWKGVVHFVGLVAQCAIFGQASEAPSATLRVPSEYPTIQFAVDAAAVEDTVLVAPGVYSNFSGRIVDGFLIRAGVHMKDGIAIVSDGGAEVTTIDMLQSPLVHHAMFGLNMPSTTTLVEGFTIRGTIPGRAGVLLDESGQVTWRGCTWRDADGDGTSSGAFSSARTDVVLEQCVFRDCVNVGGAAAGPALYSGSVSARNCLFQDLTGGGLAANANFSPETLVVEDCTFIRCQRDDDSGGPGGINCLGFTGGVRVSKTTFLESKSRSASGGIQVGNGAGAVLFEDCLFWKCGVTNAGAGGGGVYAGQPVEMRRNTFFECYGGTIVGGNTVLAVPFSLIFHSNVIVSSIGPGAAVRGVAGLTSGDCNVFWNNPGGNAVGYSLGPRDRDVDPLFCDAIGGDFTVDSASPCLPPYSDGCGFIGAFPQGCGAISIDPESWGHIKERYR